MNLPQHLTISLENDKIISLRLHPKPVKNVIPAPVLKEINAYLVDPKHTFNLPLAPKGTPFQLNVWKALQTIPAGKTMTYGELATQLKTSPRAVGQACRTNPIPLIVPCHRVVGAKGPGGYTGERKGEMMDIKLWLLKHESA